MLFKVFLGIFIATSALAIIGIVAEFAFPDRSVPYLKHLVWITLGEVAGGIVLSFNQRNERPAADPHANIRRSLELFKAVLTTGSDASQQCRLHYLEYDPKHDRLTMAVQDGAYQDRHFEMGVEEGLEKKLVVCEALRANGLRGRDLPPDHFQQYPDSPIRATITAVLASPVSSGGAHPDGVVAMDFDIPFKDIEIPRSKLEAMFLKLCTIIEDDLKDMRGAA